MRNVRDRQIAHYHLRIDTLVLLLSETSYLRSCHNFFHWCLGVDGLSVVHIDVAILSEIRVDGEAGNTPLQANLDVHVCKRVWEQSTVLSHNPNVACLLLSKEETTVGSERQGNRVGGRGHDL